MRIGEIDPRCVSDNNELPKLTPQQAASWIWKPDAANLGGDQEALRRTVRQP